MANSDLDFISLSYLCKFFSMYNHVTKTMFEILETDFNDFNFPIAHV